MDISFDTMMHINEILRCNDDEVYAAIKFMMMRYARKSIINVRNLLDTISDVSKVMCELTDDKVSKYIQAADMLIFQNACPNTLGKDKVTAFATTVPVCVSMFPNGYPKTGSSADKKYYENFLEMFKDKRCFNWERDRSWAKQYGYESYLEMVERQIADCEGKE